MKKVVFLILIIAVLSACRTELPTDRILTLTPSLHPIAQSSSTLNKTVTPESTSSSTPSPTIVKTTTPESTLSPDEIKKEISLFVQTNGNCSFPCFWGLVPEKTSQTQLENLLRRLGKEGFIYNDGDHIYESNIFSFDQLGTVDFQADIQNGVIRNIETTLDGLWHPEITPKDWSAYNLSNVLKKYGPPTHVEMYLDLPNNLVLYDIRLIYEDLDTIILFSGMADPHQNPPDGLFNVCPNATEIIAVKMQFGKNPINNEPQGLPLSTATSLSVDEFTKLFEQDSQSACFTVDIDAFPGRTVK